jgi:hypothetical protein
VPVQDFLPSSRGPTSTSSRETGPFGVRNEQQAALTDHPTGLVRVELEGKCAGDAISFNGRELVIEEVA